MPIGLRTWVVAAGIVCGMMTSTARADIVVNAGANNSGTDIVLLNPATNILTVTGTVGNDGLGVTFTSTSGSGLLSANPSGEAPISGGTGNTALTQLTFGLADDAAAFTRGVFNINAGSNGSVLIHVEGNNIDGGFFEDDFTLASSGENPFTVDAINGQSITSIALTAINGAAFEDIRQVRLGGGSVPEPATGLMMGVAVVGLAPRVAGCGDPGQLRADVL